MPTESQREIAAKLGLDISSDSRKLAAARIRDAVEPAIDPKVEHRRPSEAQHELAAALGLDISSEGYRVAFVRISDALEKRHKDALHEQGIRPGDRVRQSRWFEFEGSRQLYEEDFTVASVRADGRVYFKGANGRSAWASDVKKVSESESG